MLFNSFQFLVFFPLVTIIYFLLPHKFRWFHLLLASCVFYAAFIPIYILILFFTILIDYCAGIAIENSQGGKRKLFLTTSIIANVGVLAIFKYYNFFTNNINELLNQLHITAHGLPILNMILPIGLSFHTFQAMSYTIEVYRGNQKAERHLGIYALYVMFYPQLVAGPIERPQNILHQFYEKHSPDAILIENGLRKMLWGLVMKVVIADRVAIFVNAIYNNVPENNGTMLLLASFFFAIQIYCDFAGYSYIAIGAAQVMGFDLMTNFKRPYFSTSIDMFWKRWHISLSTWFRDYLYIPLGGNRVPVPRWYFNLFIVFVVSGLWHGANWTYIIWGALNGFYLIFAIVSKKWRDSFNRVSLISRNPVIFKIIQIVTTFCLVTFAWIFFRANTVTDAFLIVKKIFTELGPLSLNGSLILTMLYAFSGIALLFLVELYMEYSSREVPLLQHSSVYVKYASYAVGIVYILLFGVFDGGQFIYFQF